MMVLIEHRTDARVIVTIVTKRRINVQLNSQTGPYQICPRASSMLTTCSKNIAHTADSRQQIRNMYGSIQQVDLAAVLDESISHHA